MKKTIKWFIKVSDYIDGEQVELNLKAGESLSDSLTTLLPEDVNVFNKFINAL